MTAHCQADRLETLFPVQATIKKGKDTVKLYWGPPPDSDDFNPVEEGWSTIHEPNPVVLQLISIPIAVVIAALLIAVITWGIPHEIAEQGTVTIPLVPIVLVLLLMIPAHELLHALSQPSFGRTDKTYIGIWLKKVLFYAHYEGELPRGHFLWIFFVPFLILTLIPVGLILFFGRSMPQNLVMILAFLAVLNGTAASGDVLGFILIAAQVPRTALVRNKGWKTYWKDSRS
jgi:hypothetical protein